MPSTEQSRNDLRDRPSSNGSSVDLSEIHSISARICQILFPVTLCSIYVACLVRLSAPSVNKSADSLMARTWSRIGLSMWPSNATATAAAAAAAAMDDQSLGRALLGPLIIALLFVALIVSISIVMLFVFYMRWHACLTYYFYLPSLLIMALISPAYLRVIAKSSPCEWFALDLITLAIITWNFTALGMMAIFSLYASAPLIIQQLYLIHNSALVAVLIVNYLPGWTPWILLIILVIWDMFAVLTPFGPLNLIISMAERSGIVDMPGLIYSTDVTQGQSTAAATAPAAKTANKSSNIKTITGRPDSGRPADSIDALPVVKQQPMQVSKSVQEQPSSERKSIQEKGVNIGLGDFIFYGLLVGLTVQDEPLWEFYTTIATFLSILVGVVVTLIILTLTRRSLPALPISIALGMLIATICRPFCPTLADRLASEQIFI